MPPSKSQTLRAILFASLAQGQSSIVEPLDSPDARAMRQACELLGARFTEKGTTWLVEGVSGQITGAHDVINAGNSGIVLRFMTAIAALGSQPVVLTGDESIRSQRPMNDLLDGLKQLGVNARSTRNNGFAPLIVEGPLKGGYVQIQGADSQPVSALLIAAAIASQAIDIEVLNPGEIPWVAMTLDWLDKMGVNYRHENFKRYHVEGGASFAPFRYEVPGDWSSAAFPIAAALVTRSDIELSNLDSSGLQGDRRVLDLWQDMGAKFDFDEAKGNLKVYGSQSRLKGRTVDINGFIDAVTILAVVACYSEGRTELCNAAVARNKESNRLKAICCELKKMGADISETDEGLVINGGALHAGELESYSDHRMAMSLAVAAWAAKGNSRIKDIDCINKTFPSFVKSFQSLGASLESQP